MEKRVARLEVEFEHVRKDLDDIKADLKVVLGLVYRLPTMAGLWGMVATVVGVSVAMIALFVGILAYLQAISPAP